MRASSNKNSASGIPKPGFQGDSYRAQCATKLSMITPVRESTNMKRSVNFAAEIDALPDEEYLQIFPEDSVETNELPSTITKEEVEQQPNLFSSTIIRPGPISYGGRSSTPNRVEWSPNNGSGMIKDGKQIKIRRENDHWLVEVFSINKMIKFPCKIVP